MMRYFDLQIAKRITSKRQSSILLSLSSNFQYNVQKSNSFTLSSNFQYTVGNIRAVREGIMDLLLLL